jgi:hypothetical protein
MPVPRARQVCLDATPYYHCISRCVRRAFLCGDDPLTSTNFDHRRGWIAERLAALVGIFAIDVCAYGLMSNHFHVVLHVDRLRAAAWSAAEVVARYRRLFPHAVRQADLLPEAARTATVDRWRARLTDLSWFMRGLNEWIARQANAEDHCTGRFWEGRFRSQALLDEGALLTCMTYVDLNPVRARVAARLEDCDWTSIQARLLAAARDTAAVPPGLVPFADQAAGDGTRVPMEFADYVAVLRWTAAAITAPDEAVTEPAGLATTLARRGLAPAGFVNGVRTFARTFFTMVGHVHRIDVESRRRGYRRRPGIAAARRLYGVQAA